MWRETPRFGCVFLILHLCCVYLIARLGRKVKTVFHYKWKMTKNDLQHPIWRATCLDRYSRDMQAKCPHYLGAGGWSVTQACMHLQTKTNFSLFFFFVSSLVCSPETKFSQFILAQILIKTRTCCLFPLPFAAIHHSVYQQLQLACVVSHAEMSGAWRVCWTEAWNTLLQWSPSVSCLLSPNKKQSSFLM